MVLTSRSETSSSHRGGDRCNSLLQWTNRPEQTVQLQSPSPSTPTTCTAGQGPVPSAALGTWWALSSRNITEVTISNVSHHSEPLTLYLLALRRITRAGNGSVLDHEVSRVTLGPCLGLRRRQLERMNEQMDQIRVWGCWPCPVRWNCPSCLVASVPRSPTARPPGQLCPPSWKLGIEDGEKPTSTRRHLVPAAPT